MSTPRLRLNLHTICLAKAVSDGLKDIECKKIAYTNVLQFPMSLRRTVFKRWYLPSETTISRQRLAKVRSYEFLSGTSVHARNSSSMWDLPWKPSRERGTFRPTNNLTRSTWSNMG
jgi:hypothetical protein